MFVSYLKILGFFDIFQKAMICLEFGNISMDLVYNNLYLQHYWDPFVFNLNQRLGQEIRPNLIVKCICISWDFIKLSLKHSMEYSIRLSVRIILESEVNLAEPGSPSVPLLPPFHLKSNSSQLQRLHLPVSASNGHPIQFSLPSSRSYLSSHTGAPAWVHVDANTGLLSFNSSQIRQAEGLTCFLVQARDAVANLKVIFLN